MYDDRILMFFLLDIGRDPLKNYPLKESQEHQSTEGNSVLFFDHFNKKSNEQKNTSYSLWFDFLAQSKNLDFLNFTRCNGHKIKEGQ